MRKRDKCQKCGKEIEPRKNKMCDYEKDNMALDNLVSLCLSCHNKTNYRREAWKTKLSQ